MILRCGGFYADYMNVLWTRRFYLRLNPSSASTCFEKGLDGPGHTRALGARVRGVITHEVRPESAINRGYKNISWHLQLRMQIQTEFMPQ